MTSPSDEPASVGTEGKSTSSARGAAPAQITGERYQGGSPEAEHAVFEQLAKDIMRVQVRLKERGGALRLEHLPILWGHLMGQSGSFGQARRAARCGAPESQMAGKRRPKALWAADEPLWPTEGRVLWSRGRGALLIRCPASHLEALRTTGPNNPGQMTP